MGYDKPVTGLVNDLLLLVVTMLQHAHFGPRLSRLPSLLHGNEPDVGGFGHGVGSVCVSSLLRLGGCRNAMWGNLGRRAADSDDAKIGCATLRMCFSLASKPGWCVVTRGMMELFSGCLFFWVCFITFIALLICLLTICVG